MPVVEITNLETILGAPGPISRGHVQVVYWAGTGPYVAVSGGDVIFPAPIVVEIVDGALVAVLDLVPTNDACCVRIEVWSYDTNQRIRVFRAIPASGPVDFGDLVAVDPTSFAPVVPTPTLIETIDARIANHGSTDGSNINAQPNSAAAKAQFKGLLEAWIPWLRTQMSTPTVPYLMMQMRPSLLSETRHNINDQAQQEIAADTAFVNVGYATSPNGSSYNRADSVHFNALGVRTIGHSLFDVFEVM